MHSSADRHAAEATWDGHLLALQASAACRLDIRLDGSRFVELQADANGRASLAMPFSPSGNDIISVQMDLPGTTDDEPMQAFRIEFDKAGLLPATDRYSATLAPAGNPLPVAERPLEPEVAIIVPVYNAAAEVRRCLDSVLASSSGRCRLIVIDDASTDPEITPLLAGYRGIDGVDILANPANLGFTATVNRGMSLAGEADVVLLNADTEVAGPWLTGLRHAVHSAPDIATATAVSDNAGAFSVPELEHENPFPPQWTFAQTARAHWQAAGHVYPELPTGNGFCMYIRRSILDEIGLFDVDAFPQGYGEENDFCQRACAAGYRHVIAGTVLVRHARSQSFGAERREALGKAGMQVLRERWPDYESDVGRQLFSYERRVLDWRVRRIHALAASHVPKPRLLRYCSLADSAVSPDYDTRMLEMNGKLLCLDGEKVRCRAAAGQPENMDQTVSCLLVDHAIELVELEQGMDPRLSETLQVQADRLGIPMLSLAIGETATFAQREAARHSMNRFKRMTR
ncbi:glycosyltransferase family 2 protein [Dokdonella sp.]|uniref:glycosyltransferase family 2 protein n=1 Tax=Dokdonella sp. TaxID=2291710 RepID=UPI003529A208